MSAVQIFKTLESAGLIADARIAHYYYRWYGARTLKAGEYHFDGSPSLGEIIAKIEAGEVVLHILTIPEGLTAAEIADRMEDGGVCRATEYVEAARNVTLIERYDPLATSLEGYLFPDTYAFPKGVTARQIVARQVKTFLKKYVELRQQDVPVLGFRDGIILGSLVEKETGQPDERPLVASVFVNRMRRSMLLQCDPTVIYAMMLAGINDGTIRRSDLAMDSPYNTYRHAGLPPGPICNPGMAAIEAAIYPPPTEYLYFVSRNDKTHLFSTTLEAHNRAVDRYQR